MKRKFICLIIMATILGSLTSCSKGNDKDTAGNDVKEVVSVGDKSVEKTVLSSYSDYKNYVKKNIENCETLFNKYGVNYKLSDDKSIIMNTDTKRISLGKEYNTFFSVSAGANTKTKEAKVISSIYISGHIDDKFTVDDNNMLLAFELIKDVNDKYKNIEELVLALNDTVSTMTSRKQENMLVDEVNFKVFIEKEDNIINLFILSNKVDEVSYGTLEAIQFDTYEEYKKIMRTTNAEIDEKESKVNGTYLGSGTYEENGLKILESNNIYSISYGEDKNDKYSYGIANAQNLDLSSDDFTIDVSMGYEGRKENLDVPVNGFCELVKNKFKLDYNAEELKNYLSSNIELEEFMSYRYDNKNIERAILEAYGLNQKYIVNGLPFAGMDSVSGFEYEGYNTNFIISIPAIVEGKSRR